jgi:hypothetical protein
MFAVVQRYLAELKDRWSTTGPAVQLIIAAFVILISALVALWLVDKLFIYLLARSYVDDVADVFDLNKHLAKAIALAVFVAAVYLAGKTFSRSRASRRVGYLGIVGLLIAHSLFLWQGTKDQKFTRTGEAIKCYVITHEGEVSFGEHPGIDPATGRSCRPVTPELVYLLNGLPSGDRRRVAAHYTRNRRCVEGSEPTPRSSAAATSRPGDVRFFRCTHRQASRLVLARHEWRI